jgi:hypothetical protein
MTARRRLVALTGVLLATAVTGACSSPEQITADHVVFEGLSADAVDETLDLQSGVIDSKPEDERLITALEAVVELETCRAVLGYLEAWTGTEAPAEPLVLAAPSADALALALADQPEDRPDYMGYHRDALQAHVAGGYRDGLVEHLTALTSCAWMPVEPGVHGPSINEHASAAYGSGA